MKRFVFLFIAFFVFLSFILIEDNSITFTKDNVSRMPNDWFFSQRAFPYNKINHKQYVKSLAYAKSMYSAREGDEAEWQFAGPENIEGRITDIELSPDNPDIVYIGTANGGVFKSVDAGLNWEAVFDDQSSLSIGDIAISNSNPEVVYVGTGEANAGGGSLAYDGTGVFKSNDSGETWQLIGLENSGSIGRMIVHPDNPDILYVAAMGSLFSDDSQGGVYKTTDGGSTWEQKLFISDSTGAIDLVIDPYNPETIYTAMWERVRRPGRRSYGGPESGIYKSVDGGENWSELTNGLPSLPEEKGRIGIDIAISDPQVLYAVYADSIGYFKGIYKTLDEGATWLDVSSDIDPGCFAAYGWWFGRLKVDPTNANIAYLIGFYLYKTENGGSSWNVISGWNVHVDQHALAINPENNEKIYLGNDGGFYSSQNAGNAWYWSESLPITQFYSCDLDEQVPGRIYGGAQDNGTNRTMTGNTDDWEMIYGGDGLRVLVDPSNNNYIYAQYQYGGLGRSTDGGESFIDAKNGISGQDRFNWNSPIVFDPQDPDVLYFGSNKLYKSTDRAQSWSAISPDLTDGQGGGNIVYNTLTTISVSPIDNDYIYTGSDDGNVWFSDDGGIIWSNISAGLPKRWVSSVAADPFDKNVVYVSLSGYRWDDYIPHVLRSADNGSTWVDVSANLPEAPVNEIVIDPTKEDYLYCATDMGVFYSKDGGNSWQPAGSALPIIVVNDLRLFDSGRQLIAATYGRGIYTLDLSVLTSEKENLSQENRIRCFPNPFSDYLNIVVSGQSTDKEYTIDIFNASGQKVKSFRGNNDKPIIWDATNSHGVKLEPAIYYLRLNNDGLSNKLVLVK
jgi:photosystem II stability/assembly factor-like uncharacterized protein